MFIVYYYCCLFIKAELKWTFTLYLLALHRTHKNEKMKLLKLKKRVSLGEYKEIMNSLVAGLIRGCLCFVWLRFIQALASDPAGLQLDFCLLSA